jgi:hypothetical protein
MKGVTQFGLSRLHIDVAFVPFWQLTEDPKRVRKGNWCKNRRTLCCSIRAGT